MSTAPGDIPIFAEPVFSNPSNFLVDVTGVVSTINKAPSGLITTGARTYINYWNEPTMLVTVDGRPSVDPDGSIVKYEWYLNSVKIPSVTGSVAILPLPTGKNSIYLYVTDNRGKRDKSNVVTYTVRLPLGWEKDAFNLNQID